MDMTQISQCLFQHSNVNGYQKASQETEKTKFASKLLSKVQPYTQGNKQTIRSIAPTAMHPTLVRLAETSQLD